MAARHSKRFLTVHELTESTPVLGSTAGIWDRAIKGNMSETLAEVRRRVSEARARGTISDTPSPGEATDVASSVRRRLGAGR